MKLKSKTQIFISSFLILLLLTSGGCGSKNSDESTAKNSTSAQKISGKSENVGSERKKDSGLANQDTAVKKDTKEAATKTTEPGATPVPVPAIERKIILTATMQLQTLTFENTIDKIQQKTKEVNGYIENSNITGKRIEEEGNLQNRTARLVLRVPKQSLDSFLTEVGTFGNILSKTSSGEDITGQYFDTEARLKSLRIQQERLLELLKKTGELKDIIELEKALANVTYQIENFTGTLKKWDGLIDYSTFTIDVFETQEFKKAKTPPISLLQKITSGFQDSIKSLVSFGKGLLVVIATLLPYLLLLSMIYLIIKLFYKIRKKPFNLKLIVKKWRTLGKNQDSK